MDAVNVEVGSPSTVDLTAAQFGTWVEPHMTVMAGLASRLTTPNDRDDVVQDALAAAWRKRSQFDATRGTARSWLLAIVADQARKTRRQRPAAGQLSELPTHLDSAPDLDLERAVHALPARQRMAVELHYFTDLPVTEVAAVMGCAEGTVKATLSHARASLRLVLGEDF